MNVSLADVRGISMRELYEADDPDYLTFLDLIVGDVIEAREEASDG